jgi:hypothetical protein
MIDFAIIRVRSLEIARELGYPVNESLPLLDQSTVVRSHDDIVDRLLAMLCVAACAYGFDNHKAIDWLSREAKVDLLTDAERRYLNAKAGDRRLFMVQIEGMWALAWSINAVPALDFGKPCAQDFVSRLPDLKGDKSSRPFRVDAELRPVSEIIAATDLAYCLHWAIRDSQLRDAKIPGKVEAYVVVERRRALEWLLTDEGWEDIELDT